LITVTDKFAPIGNVGKGEEETKSGIQLEELNVVVLRQFVKINIPNISLYNLSHSSLS
jgi:hypothetical protein